MRKAVPALVLGTSLALVYSFGVYGKPKVQSGPNAEVTADGLTRIDKSVMDMAWVKADLDLRPYKKLMLKGAEIQYRRVDTEGKRYRPGGDDDTEFPISEEGKAMLTQIVQEQFREELGKSKRFEIVTQPGPNTLLLFGTLVDVVSRVPPLNQPGRYDVYLSSVGEATLVFELRDSTSNEVLARAADRRAAERVGVGIKASSVTTWSEVRNLAQSWAIQLRKRLDEITVVGEN